MHTGRLYIFTPLCVLRIVVRPICNHCCQIQFQETNSVPLIRHWESAKIQNLWVIILSRLE